MKMTRAQKCELLQQNLCFKNLFETICCEREQTAAVWLENGRECSYDYEELHSRVMQTAARITDAALGRQGGWVGLCMPACAEWPVLFWGLLAAGRKPLLLNADLPDEKITALLTHAGADALVIHERRAGLREYAQRTPAELMMGAYSEAFSPAWADRMALCSGGTEDARVYVYNGRAVCLQAIALIGKQRQHCMTHEQYGRQRTLCLLPLDHIFGFMAHVATLALEGNPQVYASGKTAEAVMSTCRVCRVELIVAAPLLLGGFFAALQLEAAAQTAPGHAAFRGMQRLSLMLQTLWPEGGMWLARHVLFKKVNNRLLGATLRQIVLGGGAVSREQLRDMAALGYCVSAGYGMTETALIAYDGAVDMEARLSGGAGQLLPIARAHRTEDGELVVSCDAMHMGQMRDGRLVPPALDENGMYHTGDIVSFDRRNRLYIRGRQQEALQNAAGEWIYPEEVEVSFSGMGGVQMLSVLRAGVNGRDALVLVLSLGKGMWDVVLRRRVHIETQERNALLPTARRVEYVFCTAETLPCDGIRISREALRRSMEAGTFTGELLEAEKGSLFQAARAEKVNPPLRRVTAVEEMPEYIAWQEQLRATGAAEEDGGEAMLNFAGRDYAGMSQRPEIIRAAREAAAHDGVAGGRTQRFDGLERCIAQWKNAEAAVAVSSGYTARAGVPGSFCGKGDLIICDAQASGALLTGCRMSEAVCRLFPHSDVYALEGILRAQRDKFRKVLIVCQGAYDRDGDVAPVAEYVRLKKQFGAFLLVDEGNTDGVLGENGAGVVAHFALSPEDIDIRLGTLADGVGAGGGYLCGRRALMEYLRCALMDKTEGDGLSPMLAAAAEAAIGLLQSDHAVMTHLRENIRLLIREARQRGLDTCLAGECAMVPILIGNDSDVRELSRALRGKGVLVPSVVYPAVPRNSARLRMSVSSRHSAQQIVRALDLLMETADEMGIDIRRGSVKI